MRNLLLRPPVYDDLLRLLGAWKVWVGGAVLGAAVATIVYLTFPPSYRAQATVLVDQNVEQVIPQEQTDLLKFNYLQRETDKLIEIAWADQTLSLVASKTGLSIDQLRDGRLLLTQPSDGAWHFMADATNPDAAALLASAWAGAFVEELQSKPAGISDLLEINFTQQQDLPILRTVSLGAYVFCGSLIGIAILAILLLFFNEKGT